MSSASPAERQFRNDIIASIRHHGCHLVNLEDEIKNILPALSPEVAAVLAKRIPAKPYDLAFLHKGKYVALELKVETQDLTVNLQNIVEAHQFRGLREVALCGGVSGVLVRVKKGLTLPQKKRLGIENAWAVDLTYFISSAIMESKASWSIEALETEALRIDKHKDVYDLCQILKKSK